MARAAKKKKSSVVSVNFEGVDMSGGTGFHIPEGEYGMKVDSVEQETSKNDNEMFHWVFSGTEGKAKGKKFHFYTPLTDDSLWKLGLTLQALGEDVPDGEMDIDLEDLVDKECRGIVIDDEYQGKTRSKLQSVEPLEDEEEQPEASSSKGKNGAASKKASAKKKTPEKLDADEVKAMSEDELEELNEEHELEVDLSEHKTLRRKAAAIVTALEEKDLVA